MNKFRRDAILLLCFEAILILVANVYLMKLVGTNEERTYRVDIRRIVNRMEQGEKLSEIDLKSYDTVISVRQFNPSEQMKHPYEVMKVKNELYRFEYKQDDGSSLLLLMNVILGVVFLFSCFLMIYFRRKLISPFSQIRNLPSELAKGNLTVPIKEEKSKYYGQFLWGMDMLREKLEEDRARELELIKERKMLILSLSHDIKTPLSAIDLYCKALRSGLYQGKEKQEEALGGIAKNVEEIKKYVGEIVDASREDFLSLEVVNQEVYLSECMSVIQTYYSEKMERLHIEFHVADLENCLIWGDQDRIVEVLQNILENAIKYGDGKSIKITFGEEEDCKLITVCNTGEEISSDEVPHLFESFYRGKNSKNVTGSGLGLYICKQLMHKMNGEIFVKTEKNQFFVTLVLQKM